MVSCFELGYAIPRHYVTATNPRHHFSFILLISGVGGAYALYALFALLSFFFVRPAVRETKGRTLEQM